ncbi:penicillin-binding transpeptidase domain-containing protein [Lacrimispora sp. BS-2]|uniref:Penicillin-binding transpeptidase domain-containing protein n=1 Tax=Lacrimispora sp. BS-2 TaxID=3151850 RepID=A0AAU7PS53_9FIRM
MQEKLAITVLVITLALFALVMTLYNLMTNKKEDYNQIVLSQQEYDSRTIPFKRGDIMDRNGTYLATSQKVYNLILDPKQIMSNQDSYLEPTVTALVECFGYDRTEIMNLIQEKKDKQYVRYAKQLAYDDKQKYEKYKAEQSAALKKSGKSIKGIWFEDEYKRVYPYNSMGCNVIGFANGDGMDGTGGIEQFYNTTLMGTNGREYGYLNDDSNLERVIKPAANGNTVVSTIDVNIQKIVEKYINEWEQNTGSKRVGVIVMDPNNGEVLAMANDKAFDLNNPRTLRPEYTDDVLRQLGIKEAMDDYKRKNKEAQPLTEANVSEHYTNEEIMSLGTQVAWNQTWRNFCISDGFEPGSTEKIFTISAALEEGAITGNETYECNKFLEVGGHKINCVSRYGHGLITAEEGLMKSCNVVMMRIAQQMGKEKFYKYQQIFGFGSKTGIDLPGEADNKTLVYTLDTAGPTDLVTNAFGQNFSTTMIQMAAAYCSVINGGSYYEPHVVRQILNEQGSVIKKAEPVLVRETVSESTTKFINEALFKTVNAQGGTGGAAKVEGYKVAGKTGTAEKIPRDKTNYVVSFCGYAPSDNPQVLVYVVVDEPHVEDQPHSTYASQIFQKIMNEILPYINVFPDTDAGDSPSPEDTAKLPEQEGITSETENSSQEEAGAEETGTEETTGQVPTMEDGKPIPDEYLNPSEEYVNREEGDGGSNLPAALPSEETTAQ